MKHLPPGPQGYPVIGSIREFQQNGLEFLTQNRERYGKIVYFRAGPRRVYQLNDPEDIQYVLVKHPEQFYKSPSLKRVAGKVIGQGLLTSEGDLHKRQRKLVQPAFHHQRIANYAGVMVDYTERMLNGWQDGQSLDIAHEMMKLTMHIVAKTLFDADISASADALGAAITIGLEATMQQMTHPLSLPEWVPTRLNHKRRDAAVLMEKTIMGFINERRKSGVDKGDLLSMLLMAVDDEDGGQMSDNQARDEVMTLFIAGHETTANALAWTFYLLAQHPEVEARLVEEITSVLDDRCAALSDLPRLTYLMMVIRESLRLYPPAWVITREVQGDIEVQDYRIPAKSIVVLPIYAVHRDPRYWDQPDRFQPERFEAGWEERIPRYAYLPFGGGPRVCIGNQFAMMEAQLVLATILQHFRLSMLPGQTVVPQPLVTLRPQHGIGMQISKRDLLSSPRHTMIAVPSA